MRRFKDTEVSDGIIGDILESGQLAPETDSCSYYFGVIRDPRVKGEIGRATLGAEWVAQAPVIFVCCSDISWDIREQGENDYGVIGNQLRYGEEIVTFLIEHEHRKPIKTMMLTTPVYLAAQQMILTAVSHDLRGCLVDFIAVEKINKILGLPEHITCQLLVPVGYADETPREKSSRNEDRVFYDQW